MKQMFRIIAALWLGLFFITGCGSSPEDQAGAVIKQQTDVTEVYVNDLEKAGNADDVVAAIEKYTKGMEKLIPDIKALQENYPEYQQGKIPEGMEKEMARLREISEKLPGAMMKTASYMMDPKVQAAMQNMGREMSKIGQ
ncbi:MAG: hypothetical protein HUN04_07095 [Desulfobacter sp.]|nr:MAG: hypothetical protein HUN04_07095 [Desulfobacter sp.]